MTTANTQIWKLSALEIADAIKRKEISCEETMTRRNQSFPILFLIWFTTFPIPKSRQSAGIDFNFFSVWRGGG